MVYSWIDGSIIIADVIDRFNIDTTDWIPRIGYWIENALADIKLLPTAPNVCKKVNAENYLVKIPTKADSIIAVEVDGVRIYNSDQIKQGSSTKLTYTLLHNGYIRLESDSTYYIDVEVTIYYKGYSTLFNETVGIDIPLVPDKPIVIEAVSYFVFRNILARGYNHPIFSISGNDPFTNVNVIYKGVDGKSGVRKRAMVEAKTMNNDTRELASKHIRTFLDTGDYPNRGFDGNLNQAY